MEKITLQKIFDLAWDHFIVNRSSPALNYDDRSEAIIGCSYLDRDGNKCAIGLALPEGHPAQQANMYFVGLVREYPELFDAGLIGHMDSLKEFQSSLHDDHVDYSRGGWSSTPKQMEEAYRRVAERYGLTVPNSVLA